MENVSPEELEPLRIMAASSPVMIWATTAEGKVKFVNRAYRDFFGLAAEEVKSVDGRKLVHPDDLGRYADAYAEAVRVRGPFRARCRVRRADGQWRWVESYGSPYYSPSGEFLGIVGSSPDVTEQVRAEEELRESDRRKERFIAVLAHELRNPLAPIRNAVELLAGDPPPERIEAVRGIVDRQLAQLTRLVEDLLDASRAAGGKMPLRRERVDLREAVDSALESVRNALEAERHEVWLIEPAEPLEMQGDRVRLTQVLVNLLQNAAKFTPRAGRIVIELRREGDDAVVEVTDNGIGIEPLELERIFGLFEQVEAPDAGRRHGLGIGLSLAKRLVELHGGTIRASSEGRGRGATFTVRVPAAPQSAPEGDDAETPTGIRAPTPISAAREGERACSRW